MTTTPNLWFRQTQVNTSDRGLFQGDSQIVGLQDGGYVVVWEDDSFTYNPVGAAVVGQRYDAAGNMVGGETLLSPLFLGGGNQHEPAVTLLSNGNIAVAFVDQEGGNNDIYVRIFDPSLHFVREDKIDVSAIQTVNPSITALSGGSYVVSYTAGSGDDTDILARFVSPGGVVGAQLAIDNQTDNRDFSELARLSNGNFVAVYQDEFGGSSTDIDIKYGIFTPAGAPVALSQFVPGAFDTTAQTDPDVAALRDGGFAVVWTEPGSADGKSDVHVSVLSNTGATIAADILVNTSTAGAQDHPNVIALADGGFEVTWVDHATDFARTQRFDALADKIGAETTVKVAVTGSPEAALLADGRFAYAIDAFNPISSGDTDATTSIWDPRTPTANFDGLNQSDLLWQSDSREVAVWLLKDTNLGDSSLWSNPAAHLEGTGDFNADSRSDLLWQADSGQAVVSLMNGITPTTTAVVGPNMGPTWHVIDSGDFNTDNHSDILWQNDNGQAAIWLVSGTSLVGGDTVGPNMGPSWHAKASGDFNADGHSDILWQNDNGQAAIWLVNGTGLVGGDTVGPNMGPSWHVIDAGDFNGDSHSDILWQNDNGQAAIWLMNGTSLIGGNTVGPNQGADWHVIGAGQYNNADTKSDILWQHDSGQAAVWLMDGTSLLSGVPVGLNPGADWHLIA
jgi:hypothetical protein